MKNPEKQSPNCPAAVYGNRECTKPVKKGAPIGWMMWGRRVVAVVNLNNDGLFVPFNLVDQVLQDIGHTHETA